MKLRYLSVVLLVALFASACQSIIPAVSRVSVTSLNPINELNADVIVVGSSLAGWAAAISSAREGASTILITETHCVGGQASCAGVSTWDGIGQGLDSYLRLTLEGEYKLANVAMGGCYNPTTNPGPDTYVEGASFCPHPQAVEQELLSWLNLYGVTLVGPVDVIEIRTDGSVVTADGVLRAKVVVEATETGELIPVALRREVDSLCKQHTTWVAGIREHEAEGNRLSDINLPVDTEYRDFFEQQWLSGSMWNGLNGRDGIPVYRRTHDLNGDLVIYLNWMNDAITPEESRHKTMQQLMFLADHGYGGWRWGLRSIPYIRTSDYRLNGQDHLGATERGVDSWPNSVSVSNYRADYHGDACTKLEGAEPYGLYDVPIGIGVPAKRVPVLVAMPRSGDVSDLRATSLRMQPDEITFGEAIGALAGWAAAQDVLPHDVNISALRVRLEEHKADIDV